MKLLFLAGLFFLLSDHAIYISVMEVDLDSDSTRISIKVFTDDLENAIYNFDSVKYQPDSFLSNNSQLIQGYFNAHISIQTPQPVTLDFQNGEKVGDSYWLYFKGPAQNSSFKLEANYLMELFPTQENIIKIKNGENTTFCRLNLSNKVCEYSW